jgi:hypothetical protein
MYNWFFLGILRSQNGGYTKKIKLNFLIKKKPNLLGYQKKKRT